MREHIRRLTRLAVILLANVALLVALLVIIEGLSSYAFFVRDLVPRLRESNLSHTEYDAEIGWVGLPNVDIKDMYGPGAHLRTNGQGFRNAEDFPAKRDSDMRRIVCSGDSVTFGEHVGNDQTFCSVLAELDPKLETINMGQVGYGVDQAYLWYKRDADDLDVDVHVFAFITHDFMRMQYDEFMGIPRPLVVLEDGKPVVTNVPISQSTYAMPTWLAETMNSADGLRTVKLATGIRRRLNLAPRKVPGAWDARGAEEVKAVVAGLFEDLRDYDSARSRATVLVYFPSVEELQQPNAELAYWMSVVESNARRLDIPFINFVSVFGELPAADVTRLFVDGYHFSEEGNALVAREILKYLRDDPRTAGRFVAPGQSSDGQPTPDSGVCPPQTCESLGHVCGTPQDGCGGTLSCGVCGDGETCSSGACVAPGSNWWETVTRPDATNTGPNNPGLLGTGTPPPSRIKQNGATYENFTMTGCVRIEANNVTLRNFTMDVGGCFTGIRLENGVSGSLIEYGEVDGNNSGGDCLRGLGATIRYMNVHSCDDSHKAQGLTQGPLLVEHSYYWDNDGGHGDAVQSYEKSNNVTFRYNHLVGGRTSAFIMNEPPDPGYTFVVQNNWLNGDGQAFKVIYCGGYGEPVKFLDNLFGRDFKGTNPVYYSGGSCNWYDNYYWDDFSPVEHPSVWEP